MTTTHVPVMQGESGTAVGVNTSTPNLYETVVEHCRANLAEERN